MWPEDLKFELQPSYSSFESLLVGPVTINLWFDSAVKLSFSTCTYVHGNKFEIWSTYLDVPMAVPQSTIMIMWGNFQLFVWWAYVAHLLLLSLFLCQHWLFWCGPALLGHLSSLSAPLLKAKGVTLMCVTCHMDSTFVRVGELKYQQFFNWCTSAPGKVKDTINAPCVWLIDKYYVCHEQQIYESRYATHSPPLYK